MLCDNFDYNCPQGMEFPPSHEPDDTYFDTSAATSPPLTEYSDAGNMECLTEEQLKIYEELEMDEALYKGYPYNLRLTPARCSRRYTTLSKEFYSSTKKRYQDDVEISYLSPIDKDYTVCKKMNFSENLSDLSYSSPVSSNTSNHSGYHVRKVRFTEPVQDSSDLQIKSNTVQQPFYFETDKRIKGHSVQTYSKEIKDFAEQLRSNSPVIGPVNRCTKVEPFHFRGGQKRKREMEQNHIPLAQQIAAFHRKTPKRFHTTAQKEFQPRKHWSPPRLSPHSPNLKTKKRCRKVTALSRTQLEEEEINEMKKYEFHATSFDPEAFSKLTLPNVSVKPVTVPKDVFLKTEQRSAINYGRKKEEEEKYEFHAQPVPENILKGCTGLKEKRVLPKTEPVSPSFALRERNRKWKMDSKQVESAEKPFRFKAQPKPDSKPFQVKHNKERIRASPFSFEQKDKERKLKKELKIQQEIEKENRLRLFQARPMPSPKPSSLPAVPKKAATRPEPFQLHTAKKRLMEDLFAAESLSFKAQPASVLKKQPFVPEKRILPTIEVCPFSLSTEVRAVERQHQMERKREEEAEAELQRAAQLELQRKQEMMEIAEYRQQIVHRANPVRRYKGVHIKPSTKQLTVPHSPSFFSSSKSQ